MTSILDILGVEDLKNAKEIITNQLFTDISPKIGEIEMIIKLCETHNLNPLLGELYIRRDYKNVIYPTLTVDGWYKLVNSHPECDGYEFFESEDLTQLPPHPFNDSEKTINAFSRIGCKIYRKGRKHTPIVYEYIAEVFNPFNTAWLTHPNRLLRHKSFSQAARIVFNLSGIYDVDEVERIIQSKDITKERPVNKSQEVTFEVIKPGVKEVNKVVETSKPVETPIESGATKGTVKEEKTVEAKHLLEPLLKTEIAEKIVSEEIKVTEPPEQEKSLVKQYIYNASLNNLISECVKHLKGRISEEYHPFIELTANEYQ